MRTRLPQIPATGRIQDRAAAQAIDAAKQTLETWAGVRGDPLDRVITYRDLGDTDLADIQVQAGQPVIRPAQPSGPAATVLSNLNAAGAFENVILTWDGTNQANYGHTEIWRNTVDNLGTAVMVGTSIAAVYADPVGQGFDGFYWVRAVNGQGSPGPFNATAGVAASTAGNMDYLIDQLTGIGDAPFVHGKINGTTTVGLNGNLLIDGTVTTRTLVANAVTADKINVTNLAAVAATMGTVTGGTFRTGASPSFRTEISSSGGFPIWYGNGSKIWDNANFVVDANGNVGIAGIVYASNIADSYLSTDSLKIDCGGGRFAPWLAHSQSSDYLSDSQTSMTLDMGRFYCPSIGSGYSDHRVIAQKMDFFIDINVNGNSGHEHLFFEFSHDGGGWASVPIGKGTTYIDQDLNFRGTMNVCFRWTSITSWQFMDFRARTDQGCTQGISGKITVYNTQESIHASNSVGGLAGTSSGHDTSDGGSGPHGGGNSCVVLDSILPTGRAGDVRLGDSLILADAVTLTESTGAVTHAQPAEAPCVEITCANGVALACSTTAPIATDGGYVDAPELLGCCVPTLVDGRVEYSKVVSVEDIGIRWVMHITVGDRAFWAGKEPGRYLLHHNMKAQQ